MAAPVTQSLYQGSNYADHRFPLAAGPVSAPGVRSLFGQPVEGSNTIGFHSRPRIMVPSEIHRWDDGSENELGEAQLIFKYQPESAGQLDMNNPPTMTHEIALNLVQLNRYLTFLTKEIAGKNGQSMWDVDDVLKHFKCVGVLNNETGKEGDEGVFDPRMINITSYGECRAYQVFGQRIRTGTRIFIVIAKHYLQGDGSAKRVPEYVVSAGPTYDGLAKRTRTSNKQDEWEGALPIESVDGQEKHYYVQVYAYADYKHPEGPPPSWYEQMGVGKGHVLYVGYVSTQQHDTRIMKSNYESTPLYYQTMATNLNEHVQMPKIDIVVNPSSIPTVSITDLFPDLVENKN